MEIKWIVKNRNDALAVLFLGWSCDENTVRHVVIPGYDVIAVYDYRDIDACILSEIPFENYTRKVLLAWSFGVWVAGRLLLELPPFDRVVAVNGTLCPVDDNYGIPEKIFAFTLKNIERQGIGKFNERMCGNSINDFTPSRRPFDEQLEELKTLASYFRERQKLFLQWDAVLIGEADSIFPVKNMVRFWEEKSIFVTLCPEMNHYPFCATGIRLIREALGL